MVHRRRRRCVPAPRHHFQLGGPAAHPRRRHRHTGGGLLHARPVAAATAEADSGTPATRPLSRFLADYPADLADWERDERLVSRGFVHPWGVFAHVKAVTAVGRGMWLA